MTDGHPKRKAYFANRYCRLLAETCAAQQIGHVSYVLCVTIAHREDAKRYKGPVTYYNEQLMPLIGVSKWESLESARNRAVQAGWLHYKPGNRGQRLPGRYWVTIPAEFDDLTDDPCDETQYPAKGERNEGQSPTQYPANGDSVQSQYPVKGDREEDREGEHSNLSLNLSNSARKTKRTTKPFIIPTIEEIRAYCLERKNKIDAEYFFDYYDARDWVLKDGGRMKKWKAVIRTWERNNFSCNGQGTADTKPPAKVRYFETRKK